MADATTRNAGGEAIRQAAEKSDLLLDWTAPAILIGALAKFWPQVERVAGGTTRAAMRLRLYIWNAWRWLCTPARWLLWVGIGVLAFGTLWEPAYALYRAPENVPGEFYSIMALWVPIKLGLIAVLVFLLSRIWRTRPVDLALFNEMSLDQISEAYGPERSPVLPVIATLAALFVDGRFAAFVAHALHGWYGVPTDDTMVLYLFGSTFKVGIAFVLASVAISQLIKRSVDALALFAKSVNIAARPALQILPGIEGGQQGNFESVVGVWNVNAPQKTFELLMDAWPFLVGVAIVEAVGIFIHYPAVDLMLIAALAFTGFLAFVINWLRRAQLMSRHRWIYSFVIFGCGAFILCSWIGVSVAVVSEKARQDVFIQELVRAYKQRTGRGNMTDEEALRDIQRERAQRLVDGMLSPPAPEPTPTPVVAPPVFEPAPLPQTRRTHRAAASNAGGLDCASMSESERSLVNDVARRDGQSPPCL